MLEKLKEVLKALAAKLNLREMLLAAAKERAIAIVQKHGDELQEKLKKAIVEKGPAAIDAVLDDSQAGLIAKIRAL